MAAQLTFALVLLWTTAAPAQISDAPQVPTPTEPNGHAPVEPPTAPQPPPASMDEAEEQDPREQEAKQDNTPAPLPAPTDPVPPAAESRGDDITLEDWNRSDWMLVKPKVSLVDLDGYLRFRGDLFQRMNFGNDAKWEIDPTQVGIKPQGRYTTLSDNSADWSQANMRLRVEPRINITEQIQIISTIDVFDNLVMGSTPNTIYPGVGTTALGGRTPVNVLSNSQQAPRRGINSFTDNIVVKRVWGRVTALNEQLELKVGRMPDQWGLGMLYNSGDCLECDYGTVVDRFALSFRAVNHVFQPMVDWVSKGPLHKAFGYWDPMPTDALAWDDAMQYGIRIFREDSREDIHDALLHNHWVFNYGLSNVVRLQARDLPQGFYGDNADAYLSDPNENTNTVPNNNAGNNLQPPSYGQRRNAFIYQGDLYAKLYMPHADLGLEAAITAGSFEDQLPNNNEGVQMVSTNVRQIGAALEGRWHQRTDNRGLHLLLKTGGASGDSRRGMGALDLADTQRGVTQFGYDAALRNFQFSPDYILDYILFRRIIGTVTDAWYLRPEAQYHFDEKVHAKLAMIYSQAMFDQSTASGSNKPLGVEFDGEVSYGNEVLAERGQLLAAVRGGLVFPLSGFDNPSSANGQEQGGSFAWTLQARMYLTF